MTKEVYIALIQKDISELDMIAQGLYETELPSPTIIMLAQSKANDLISNLQSLADVKGLSVEKQEPLSKVSEILFEEEIASREPIEEELIEEETESEFIVEPIEEDFVIQSEEPSFEAEPEEEFEDEMELLEFVEDSELSVETEEDLESVVSVEEVVEAELETPIEEFQADEVSELVVPEPLVEPLQEVVESEPIQEEVIETPKPKENVQVLTSRPVYYKEPEIMFERLAPEPPKAEPVVEEPVAPVVELETVIEELVLEQVPELIVEAPEPVKEDLLVEPISEIIPEPIVEPVIEPLVEAQAEIVQPATAAPASNGARIELVNKAQDNSFMNAMATKKIESIKRAISMVDRFRFQRELFANDGSKMNETIESLDTFTTAAQAEDYLSAHFAWNVDNENVTDFLSIVARRY